MTDKPDGERVFFVGRDGRPLPTCPEHGDWKAAHIATGYEGEVLVSKGVRLYYCRECLLDLTNEMLPVDVVGEGQAVVVITTYLAQSEDVRNALVNLGPGDTVDGAVYLTGDAPLEDIPDHVREGGLFFVDEGEIPRQVETKAEALDALFGEGSADEFNEVDD